MVLVGGVDPGGGAGLARDFATATTFQAHPLLVGTAWTLQDPSFGHAIEPRDSDRLRVCLRAALARAAQSSCVKIGMVATSSIADAIGDELACYGGPVVYDPVLCATSGGALYEGDREAVLRLARRTTLLTPNLDEAAWLLDRRVRTLSDARQAARLLHAAGISAVLVKGGHLEGEATDTLVTRSGETLFSSPRVAGKNPRGTGCALATAIAVAFAQRLTIEEAVAEAKAWLTQGIARAACAGGEQHLEQ